MKTIQIIMLLQSQKYNNVILIYIALVISFIINLKLLKIQELCGLYANTLLYLHKRIGH